jgi:1-acyl-sn-glycerol-3-phosphate acyltransferase
MRRCRIWLKGAAVAGLCLLGLAIVGVVLPGLRLLLGRRAQRIEAAIVQHWNRAACRALNLRVRVCGAFDPRAGFLVANHVSWLDIIALGSQFPCQFVAKEEVGDWPVLGWLAKGIGTLFVRRGDSGQTAATAERMLWRLRQGRRLLLFPEGTTTAGDKVLRFHSRLFRPAHLAGARLQAVALDYTGAAQSLAPFIGEDEFLPHLLRILTLDRIELRVRYCPPLPLDLDAGALAAAARQQVAAALAPAEACRAQGR